MTTLERRQGKLASVSPRRLNPPRKPASVSEIPTQVWIWSHDARGGADGNEIPSFGSLAEFPA